MAELSKKAENFATFINKIKNHILGHYALIVPTRIDLWKCFDRSKKLYDDLHRAHIGVLEKKINPFTCKECENYTEDYDMFSCDAGGYDDLEVMTIEQAMKCPYFNPIHKENFKWVKVLEGKE